MEIVLRVVQLPGDTIAVVLADALRSLIANNEVYLRAMQTEGQSLVDVVGQLPVRYRAWAPSERVVFRGYESMMLDRAWACGDAAAYEAAVLRVKYGVDAQPLIKRVSNELWHAMLRLPDGSEYDPTKNALEGNRNFPLRVLRLAKPVKNPNVACTKRADGTISCALRGVR